MKPGVVVYFKTFKASTRKRSPEMKFQGYGYGILLGMVPPFVKDPDTIFVLDSLAKAGYVRLDHVQEVIGVEAAQVLCDGIQAKYDQMAKDYLVQEERLKPQKKSGLLDQNGNPTSTEKVSKVLSLTRMKSVPEETPVTT